MGSALVIFGLFGLAMVSKKNNIETVNPSATDNQSDKSGQNAQSSGFAKLLAPISDWSERTTKKLFGIYVTPKNSPVNPEKFTGYHSGVDFEVLPGEEDTEVVVFAVCGGPMVLKRFVSGYGGAVVQQCVFEEQDIIVIYGHLKLSSIVLAMGQEIKAGEKIGILGNSYGAETDGERKHLHVGIHKGKDIDLKGYVQTSTELDEWMDITKYL